MKKTLILLVAVIALYACNKKTPVVTQPAPTPTPVTPILKDSSLKLSGIDTVIRIGIYDSITIPITVYRDTGTNQQVVLAISGLPPRVRAVFDNVSGTTPFTTNLKLYTYLVSDHGQPFDEIKIAINAASGDSIVATPKLDVEPTQNPQKLLYELYLKNPALKTINWNDNSVVYTGTGMEYNAANGRLYFTGVYLHKDAGGVYMSSNDTSKITTFYTMGNWGYNTMHFDWGTGSETGNNSVGSKSFGISADLVWHSRYADDSEYRLNYRVAGGGVYIIKGKLKFD